MYHIYYSEIRIGIMSRKRIYGPYGLCMEFNPFIGCVPMVIHENILPDTSLHGNPIRVPSSQAILSQAVVHGG
jgi:hypothetical protein